VEYLGTSHHSCRKKNLDPLGGRSKKGFEKIVKKSLRGSSRARRTRHSPYGTNPKGREDRKEKSLRREGKLKCLGDGPLWFIGRRLFQGRKPISKVIKNHGVRQVIRGQLLGWGKKPKFQKKNRNVIAERLQMGKGGDFT